MALGGREETITEDRILKNDREKVREGKAIMKDTSPGFPKLEKLVQEEFG